MLYQLTLYIHFIGYNAIMGLMCILPFVIVAYFAHAIYTHKPLKQIWKEIKP